MLQDLKKNYQDASKYIYSSITSIDLERLFFYKESPMFKYKDPWMPGSPSLSSVPPISAIQRDSAASGSACILKGVRQSYRREDGTVCTVWGHFEHIGTYIRIQGDNPDRVICQPNC